MGHPGSAGLGVSLSDVGVQMAQMSGLRGIMEDIGVATTAAPGRRWLNLGVGNPAVIPEVAEWWQRLAAESLRDSFVDTSCRYGPSRGLPRLVDAIVDYFNRRYSWNIEPDSVVIGPGSQMLCFIAAAMFTGPSGTRSDSASGATRDTTVLMPLTPDYTGYQGLALTAGGVQGVEPLLHLEGDRSFRYVLDAAAARGRTDAGMLLVSSPSNPTGHRLDAEATGELLEIAHALDIPLLIDQAYGDPFPSIAITPTDPLRDSHVINSFSLSKAGMPGERLGFLVADERFVTPIVSFLANVTLHAPQSIQAMLARALETHEIDSVVASSITPFYRERRALVEKMLVQALPSGIAWRLHASEGGMFVWLWVDEEWFDDVVLYELLKSRGLFVVPGRHFFAAGSRLGRHSRQCVRISMTPDVDDLRTGIEMIAQAVVDLDPASVAGRHR